MSYYTQRLANKFPIWSNLRIDPSSYGHRYLQPMAEALEANEMAALRLAHYNEALMGGATIFDQYALSYIDLSLLNMTFFPNPDSEMIVPSVSFINSSLQVQQIELSASWNDFYFGAPDYLQLETNATFPAIGFDSPERRTEIWNSDLAKASDLGLNDDGDIPSGVNNALKFQHEFAEAWPLSKAFRLGVSVSGSTEYMRFGETLNTEDPYLGHHKIYIRGEDSQGAEIEEEIQIYDDGYFKTNQKFTKVCKIGLGLDEKKAVEYDGFDGVVAISLTDINQKTKTCPWSRAISADGSNTFDDFDGGTMTGGLNPLIPKNEYITQTSGTGSGLEGPLLMEISEEDGISGSYLDSYFHLYSNGQMYRNKNVELEDEENLRELLCSQYLLDKFSEPITAVDFTFNWHDGKCYVLDTKGSLHIYSLSPTPFVPQTFPRTKLIDVETKPLTRRSVYGEAIPVWTWHRILRKPIKYVAIMRESPAAIAATEQAVADGLKGEPIFRGEYLQADLSWATNKYHFLGNSTDGGRPELSWKEKKFWTDFPEQTDPNLYNTLGQWNFYVETALQSDKQIQLENIEKLHNMGSIEDDEYWRYKEALLEDEEKVILHRSSTSIMCEYLVAEESYENLIDNPVGIYIDELENLTCLVGEKAGGLEYLCYRGVSHKWFPEQSADYLLLKEEYPGGVTVEMLGVTETAVPAIGYEPTEPEADIIV